MQEKTKRRHKSESRKSEGLLFSFEPSTLLVEKTAQQESTKTNQQAAFGRPSVPNGCSDESQKKNSEKNGSLTVLLVQHTVIIRAVQCSSTIQYSTVQYILLMIHVLTHHA